jgi:hypothetical protein
MEYLVDAYTKLGRPPCVTRIILFPYLDTFESSETSNTSELQNPSRSSNADPENLQIRHRIVHVCSSEL